MHVLLQVRIFEVECWRDLEDDNPKVAPTDSPFYRAECKEAHALGKPPDLVIPFTCSIEIGVNAHVRVCQVGSSCRFPCYIRSLPSLPSHNSYT